MLIKGKDLNVTQRQLVLSSFVYRWTYDNRMREKAWSWVRLQDQPTIGLVSDQKWLEQHAFYFIQDGSRLNKRHNHCVPEYVAD